MERETPTTIAPASRNVSVTKVPRPPFAPVITATLLSRPFMSRRLALTPAGRRDDAVQTGIHNHLAVMIEAVPDRHGCHRDARHFVLSESRWHHCGQVGGG